MEKKKKKKMIFFVNASEEEDEEAFIERSSWNPSPNSGLLHTNWMCRSDLLPPPLKVNRRYVFTRLCLSVSEISQKVVDSFGRNLCPVHWWTRPPDSGERLIVLTDYSRQADTQCVHTHHCLQSCAESCIDGGPECAVKMEMRAVFFSIIWR